MISVPKVNQLEKSINAKMKGKNKHKLSVQICGDGKVDKGAEARPSETNSSASMDLMKHLLDTQDKLMRAQIRLEVYRKLQVQEDVLGAEQECDVLAQCASMNTDDNDDNGSMRESSSEYSDHLDSKHHANSLLSLSSDDGEDEETPNSDQDLKLKHRKKGRRSNEITDGSVHSSETSHSFERKDSEDSQGSYGSDADVLSESGISDTTVSPYKKNVISGQYGQRKIMDEIPIDDIEEQFNELEDILTVLAGEDYVLGNIENHVVGACMNFNIMSVYVNV